MPGPVAALSLLLDGALVLLTLVSLLITVTGGGTVHVAGVRIRATSVTYLVPALAVLLLARYRLRSFPFLALSRLRLDDVGRRSSAWLSTLVGALNALKPRSVTRIVGTLIVLAITVKLAGAWFQPGFFSGDDVEIHEMSLSALYGADWAVWELRSAFFPLTFIFPVQWAVYAAGVRDPSVLVFAGRAVVAATSTAVIPLTFVAARRLTGATAAAIVAAVFVTTNQLQMAFGSSELPRPVAAAFVVGAFALLCHESRKTAIVAGTLLGVAFAFRFSECVFLAPAVLMLASRRRWFDAILLVTGAAVTGASVLAAADYLYWGAPFASLVAAVDYTLIQRASSRGYEPVFHYLVLLPHWTNWTVFALAVAGSWRSRTLALWIWVPVVALSVLPHKETRYLIPVVPFLCIAAAVGFVDVTRYVQRHWPARPAGMAAALLLPYLALGAVQDAAGWRLRRTNREVALAKWLRDQEPGGVAMRDPWRAGGRVYLDRHPLIVGITDERLATPEERYDLLKDVRWAVVDRQLAGTLGREEMRALGFERDSRWNDPELRVYRNPTR
jgi:Alg9-like mannosyltransferase family